jgi:hypothetical protein
MKQSIAFLAFFFFLGLAIIAFGAWRDGAFDQGTLAAFGLGAIRDGTERVVESNIIRDGEIVCLRRRDGERDRDCVQGLQTQDGTYRLVDIEHAGPIGTIRTGSALRIMGDLLPPSYMGRYKTLGDLRVERVEKFIVEE